MNEHFLNFSSTILKTKAYLIDSVEMLEAKSQKKIVPFLLYLLRSCIDYQLGESYVSKKNSLGKTCIRNQQSNLSNEDEYRSIVLMKLMYKNMLSRVYRGDFSAPTVTNICVLDACFINSHFLQTLKKRNNMQINLRAY